MRVFITGITGTLGTALADLHASRGDDVYGCARSEERAKKWMEDGWSSILFMGDCTMLADPTTDAGRMLPTFDRVYHCAAMKHVDLCESNPHEAFIQNVEKTRLLSSACSQMESCEFVFVSSDKACLPQGVYGATKLMGEAITLHNGGSAVRLGNLIASSGSVFKAWERQLATGEHINLTARGMTRYFIPVDEAARFIADETERRRVVLPGGMKAVRMGDLATAIAGDFRVKVVGLRRGETPHQWLVAPGERIRWAGGSKVVLGEGERDHEGLCSETAKRWDVDHLLEKAGCKKREAVR